MATPIPVVTPDVQAQEAIKQALQEPPADVVVTEEQPVVEVELPEPELQPAILTPATVLFELEPVEALSVTRRLRVKGAMTLQGKRNRFYVKTDGQRLLYTVEEDNSWWVGYCCYGLRPMQLRVRNSLGAEVMRINRPFRFTTRLIPCQLQIMKVFAPPGNPIGSVEQQWTAIKPLYLIRNEHGDEIFILRGPVCTISCFNEVQFHILRPNGDQVGSTTKSFDGIMHALFYAPVTDKFGVLFDEELPASEKALLLASTLLLDYMYYDI